MMISGSTGSGSGAGSGVADAASGSGGSSTMATTGSRTSFMTFSARFWFAAEIERSTLPLRMRRTTYSARPSAVGLPERGAARRSRSSAVSPPRQTGQVACERSSHPRRHLGWKAWPPAQGARRNSSPSAKSVRQMAQEEYSHTSCLFARHDGMRRCRSSSSLLGGRRRKRVVEHRAKRSRLASRSSGGCSNRRVTSVSAS
mmetsp:Transcript_120440/g.376874  ORF Transcript_120440/g.376874 Transcript_120440/m.376874 type:complete len:201 (+) Transcript_120440:279-881(+)